MAEKQRRERPEPYSWENQPPDLYTAYRTLTRLVRAAAQTATDLEHREPSDYDGTEDEFFDWRRKAIAALGFMRAERHFLETWVLHQHLKPSPKGPSDLVHT